MYSNNVSRTVEQEVRELSAIALQILSFLVLFDQKSRSFQFQICLRNIVTVSSVPRRNFAQLIIEENSKMYGHRKTKDYRKFTTGSRAKCLSSSSCLLPARKSSAARVDTARQVIEIKYTQKSDFQSVIISTC